MTYDHSDVSAGHLKPPHFPPEGGGQKSLGRGAVNAPSDGVPSSQGSLAGPLQV